MGSPVATSGKIEPLFMSVKDAAATFAVSTWQMYQMLDEGVIDSRYQGRRRLVSVESLRRYAASLPTSAPESA